MQFALPGAMSKKLLEGTTYGDGIGGLVHGAVTRQIEPTDEVTRTVNSQPKTKNVDGKRVPNPKREKKRVIRHTIKSGGQRYRLDPNAPHGSSVIPLRRQDLMDMPSIADARKAVDAARGESANPVAPVAGVVKSRNAAKAELLKDVKNRVWAKQQRKEMARVTGIRRKLALKIRANDAAVNGVTPKINYSMNKEGVDRLNAAQDSYDKLNRRAVNSGLTKRRKTAAKWEKVIVDKASKNIAKSNPSLTPGEVRKKAINAKRILTEQVDPGQFVNEGGLRIDPTEHAAKTVGITREQADKFRQTYNKSKAPAASAEIKKTINESVNSAKTVHGSAYDPKALAGAVVASDRPKGWKGPTVKANLTEFPIGRRLKKLGIGAAILGGGVLAAKAIRGRKDEEQKMLMSSRARLIEFAKKVKLSQMGDFMRRRRSMKIHEDTMNKAEHYASGGSNWTAPEHRGGLKAMDYSGHAMTNVGEVMKVAQKAKRMKLPPSDPNSLHGDSATFKDELLRVQQTVSSQKKTIGDFEKRIAESNNPALQKSRAEEIAAMAANARKEIDAAQAEVKGLKGSISIDRAKAVDDARTEVTSRLSGAHAAAMKGEQDRRYRHVAIGTGAGFIGGAALAGNASKESAPQKRQRQLAMSAKVKQIRFESGRYEDAKRMAISSAATGALLGGGASALNTSIPRALQHKGPAAKMAPARKVFRKIGVSGLKGGAILGVAGGAAGLIGSAILGERKKSDKAYATKSGAIGGTVVGGLGGIALALASMKRSGGKDWKDMGRVEKFIQGKRDQAQRFMTRNRRWAPIRAINEAGIGGRIAIGGGVGALAGAANMSDEGQQADTIRNLKKPVRMSSKAKAIRFAEAPLSGKLAADRYRKKIQDEDLDRRDANILRSSISGAALGGLLKGRRGAAIGAGAGALAVPLIRTRTESGRDMYGERTREGKRAEGIPWKAAGLGAAALAARKGLKSARGVANRFNVGAKNVKQAAKFAGFTGAALLGANLLMKSKQRTILFREATEDETFIKHVETEKEWRKGHAIANKVTQAAKRGTRLTKDVIRAVKGQKNLDSRGRERKREWDKPWVRNTVLAGVLGTGAILGRRIVKGTAEGTNISKLRDHWQSGRVGAAMEDKFPRTASAYRKVMGVADDASNEAASAVNNSGPLGRFNNWVGEASKRTAARKAEAKRALDPAQAAASAEIDAEKAARNEANKIENIDKYLPKNNHNLSNREKLMQFISDESDWDTRRDGDTVLLRKIRRRERREKSLLERKHWQDGVVNPAKNVGAFLAGLGTMAILHKGGKVAGSRTGGGPASMPVVDSGHAEALLRKRATNMSSITNDLIALSAMIEL